MANTNTDRKIFLAMNAGTSVNSKGEKVPYAFHVEGYVARVNTFHAAEADKPALLSLSVGVVRNPWYLLGPDAMKEQENNPDVNENQAFVSIAIFGSNAERLQNIQKGAKIVFSGRPEKNQYKKKSGEDVVGVRVAVDNIYQLASRAGTPDDLRPYVTRAKNWYESRGKENTQVLGMLSGKVLSAESLRTTPTGREVISAKLELAIPALEAEARINGTYNKDAKYGSYKTATISVWGQRATHMDRVLVPGNKLVVTGSVSTSTGKDSRQYVNVSVRELSVLDWAEPAASSAGNPSETQNPMNDAAAADGHGFIDIANLADAAGMELPF